MPKYDYACITCELNFKSRHGREPNDDEYDVEVLFETSHSISPSEQELGEALVCPRCNEKNCKKSLKNSNVISYIKGNGFLDKDGARRDMNLYHLTNDDPYAEYRLPGEVDDMKSKLEKGGKHDPKTKYFTSKSTSKTDKEDS